MVRPISLHLSTTLLSLLSFHGTTAKPWGWLRLLAGKHALPGAGLHDESNQPRQFRKKCNLCVVVDRRTHPESGGSNNDEHGQERVAAAVCTPQWGERHLQLMRSE